MSEKFRLKDIKTCTKDFLSEHKTASLKGLPLTATIISLGVAAIEQDIRLGAITTATYLAYDKTKDKVRDALKNSKEKKLKKTAFALFPDHLRKELIENDTKTLINNEENFFAQHETDLVASLEDGEYFGVTRTSDPEETEQEEPEGDTDEMPKPDTSDAICKLSVPETEIDEFLEGVLHAQYVLRANLRAQGKEFPDFSFATITAYNDDLFEAADDLPEYFDQKEDPFLNDESQLTLAQTTMILNYNEKITPMARHGATYLIGLYERQQGIEEIIEHGLVDSIPQSIKKDIAKMNTRKLFRDEYTQYVIGTPLYDHIHALQEPPGLSTFQTTEEKNDEPKVSNRIGVHTDDFDSFMDGIVVAQYLVRSVDGSPPQFSEELINGHNLNLELATRNQEGRIYQYLNEKVTEKLDNEKREQVFSILAATGKENDIAKAGGIYFLSLYEGQKEIDSFNSLLSPDAPSN